MKNRAKTYALLIAVGDYRTQNRPSLPCVEGDLETISRALSTGLKVSSDNMRILGRDGFISVHSFARAIAEFGAMLKKEDTFLFYFSGHGQREELIFSDGAVTVQSIVDYIDRLGAGSKLVILDCCYSGAAQVPSVNDLTFEESIAAFAGKGIALMASSSADSTSRLSEGGSCSLYTSIVSTAILSRRGLREGKLSLSDINAEVRFLMTKWNSLHPDRQQHPVYRDSMLGSIFFPVEEYHPYVTRKITLETGDYILHSVKPLSTGKQKRLAAFVITKTDDESALPRITDEIAEQIKNSDVFASSQSEERFRGKTADAIWCYFGHDETDLTRSNHYAYTIWAQKPEMRKLYFRENRNAEIVNGIYIFWNTSYGMVRELQKTDTPDEKVLAEYRKLENLLIGKAEEFCTALDEMKNAVEGGIKGTGTGAAVPEAFSEWIRAVRTLYYQLTDIPPAPAACSNWSEAVLALAGWVVDLAILMENCQDEWLIRETLRRYERSLDRLGEIERNNEQQNGQRSCYEGT